MDTSDDSAIDEPMPDALGVPMAVPLARGVNFNDELAKDPLYWRNTSLDDIEIRLLSKTSQPIIATRLRGAPHPSDFLIHHFHHRMPYCRVAISHMQSSEKKHSPMEMCVTTKAYNPERANAEGQDIDMVEYLAWREGIQQKLIKAVQQDIETDIRADMDRFVADHGSQISGIVEQDPFHRAADVALERCTAFSRDLIWLVLAYFDNPTDILIAWSCKPLTPSSGATRFMWLTAPTYVRTNPNLLRVSKGSTETNVSLAQGLIRSGDIVSSLISMPVVVTRRVSSEHPPRRAMWGVQNTLLQIVRRHRPEPEMTCKFSE